MGFATRLGVWVLGTIKEGPLRNTGATTVTQEVALVSGAAANINLPAGAIIQEVTAFITTGATGTAAVTVDGVSIGTISTAAGVNTLVTNNVAQVAKRVNIGKTNAVLSCTPTVGSAGVLSILYTVRESNGIGYPTSA